MSRPDGGQDGLCASLHGERLLSLNAFNSSELGTQMPLRGRPPHQSGVGIGARVAEPSALI